MSCGREVHAGKTLSHKENIAASDLFKNPLPSTTNAPPPPPRSDNAPLFQLT
jgi:hypothetical protein